MQCITSRVTGAQLVDKTSIHRSSEPDHTLSPNRAAPTRLSDHHLRRRIARMHCVAMAAMSTSGAESAGCSPEALQPTRYESRKRRDWQTFTRYLTAHRPPLELHRCSGAHVLEFLRYLDRFGKTRVHAPPCPAYGGRALATAAACQCPLSQAWGSLDALVGRLRAAFDERHGRRGSAEQDQLLQQQHDAAGANPFAARAVTLYLRDVRVAQAKARGISYHKKRKAGNKAAPSSSKLNDAASEAGARARGQESRMTAPPLPPCSPGCRSSAATSEAPLEEELIMPASTAAASTCHVPSVKDNWS